jgi:hypothetical protein
MSGVGFQSGRIRLFMDHALKLRENLEAGLRVRELIAFKLR